MTIQSPLSSSRYPTAIVIGGGVIGLSIARELAKALDISSEAIGLKAKTNEGMGWIGRGEGVATIAVATVERAP